MIMVKRIDSLEVNIFHTHNQIFWCLSFKAIILDWALSLKKRKISTILDSSSTI